MTLHEAIQQILRENNRAMSSIEITQALNEQNLYQRGDDGDIPNFQVDLRVRKYLNIFLITNDKISLVEWR